jgi:hypothetical protein
MRDSDPDKLFPLVLVIVLGLRGKGIGDDDEAEHDSRRGGFCPSNHLCRFNC